MTQCHLTAALFNQFPMEKRNVQTRKAFGKNLAAR